MRRGIEGKTWSESEREVRERERETAGEKSTSQNSHLMVEVIRIGERFRKLAFKATGFLARMVVRSLKSGHYNN